MQADASYPAFNTEKQPQKNCDILLCDLDAFFASVEQLDNPGLRGKPVLVGGSPEGRGVVSTCSYEARKFGVRSAMPMKKALALCPEATVVRGRMSRYKEASQQVKTIFEHFTPDIEVVSIDEAYLAVKTGVGYDTGLAIHEAVRDELNLPISVGISVNKLLAKIACELAKPNNVGTLWPEEVETLLWPLSVRTLPGIGPVAEQKLNQCGIKTVKDLTLCSPESLARILGNSSETIQGYARGIDIRPLEREHEAKSISEEATFPEDISNREDMLAVLMEQAAGIGYRLRSAGVTARTVTLKLRFKNFKTITRSKSMPETVSDDSEIYAAVKYLFNAHCGSGPWRLAGVQVSGFEEGSQLSLLKPAHNEDKEHILTATRDVLREKYGSDVVFQGKRLPKKKKTP